KALDEWWNLQALLKAKLFAGPNMYLPAGWTYAAGTTTIPNDQYNLSLIADLERSMMINHLEGAYITEKGDFWTMIRNAQLSAGNAEGAGDAARARILDGKFVDDFYGFQRAALTEDAFIINPSAMAVATKARFAQVATHETGSNFDRWVWSIASPELPGIRYDVIRTFKCVNSVITEHYAMKTRGDIWQNPLGCPETINGTTYTPTGIISITRGAAA
ncbi:MAG TPA: hypothetical protein VD794_08995, partial [Flavisolibacter sp.]|nr:hypothetical protein [Flavisolibacter sp.]